VAWDVRGLDTDSCISTISVRYHILRMPSSETRQAERVTRMTRISSLRNVTSDSQCLESLVYLPSSRHNMARAYKLQPAHPGRGNGKGVTRRADRSTLSL